MSETRDKKKNGQRTPGKKSVSFYFIRTYHTLYVYKYKYKYEFFFYILCHEKRPPATTPFCTRLFDKNAQISDLPFYYMRSTHMVIRADKGEAPKQKNIRKK